MYKGMKNNVTYADCFAEARAGRGMKKTEGPLQMPPSRRPRERLEDMGPRSLGDAELLAVVLNTGARGRGVLDLAGDLLELLDRCGGVPSPGELSRLRGMGRSRACAVAAMLEFGRRRWGAQGRLAGGPADVFDLVRHYADRRQERFISVSMNGAHEVLAVRVVTVGLVNRTIVHPREVFADMLQDRATAFAVAHNHPSGKLSPSPEDDEITDRLLKSSGILGLHFIDHLIFSRTGFYSYRNDGGMGQPWGLPSREGEPPPQKDGTSPLEREPPSPKKEPSPQRKDSPQESPQGGGYGGPEGFERELMALLDGWAT